MPRATAPLRLAPVLAALLALGLGVATASQAPSLALTTLARALQPGEAVVVRVTSSAPLASARVSGFGRAAPAVRVGAAGADGREVWQALLGIDVATAPGPATLRVEALTANVGTSLSVTQDVDVEPKQFRQRRLRVAPRYVTPPAKVRARIAREAERLREIYATVTHEDVCTPPFTPPVAHRLNSPFGSQSIFNGKVRGRHLGVDFASPAGAPIHAPAPGRVVLTDDLYYTGRTVVIDHGQGVHSILAHLSRISVEPDTRVATGDVVGEVGETGRASGPHLHWSIRLGGARVDPMSLVDLGVVPPPTPGN